MAMLLVDGVEIKDPSEMTYGLQDVDSAGSGRTQDGYMHRDRVAQKVKISLSWSMTTPEETAAILQAFDPEYINVTYPDAKLNAVVTREFYAGDKSCPVQIWTVNSKYYNKITFNIIER